ncbi:ABC transporter ATP-binding protein [uncultured Bacteroides sp.]|uniref:ABC transporter ATP-binding protein n=1 Tax=uncultured Bacteroides sp. TaxID=162156 RepID=UPI00262B2758|nr:ABC transporter ATP-binding protein [uncultured Bacteroides sp.]
MEIKIEQLKKCYGSHVALDIDNYTIPEGKIVGLVGNNGAGKTTLFRLILDLLKADQGNVCIGDINVAESEKWKDYTGAYMDESFLIDYLTPEEYFYFVGKMCGLDKATVEERTAPYERFMNGEILGQKKLIRNLSAGNKQKVGIVAALLNHPQLLILDEPFNFLDPSSQSALKHLLRNYHEQTQATILVSSHNLNHTVDISSKIILLEHGKIARDIENVDGNAEMELETYFEIND